jgi:hypothetical protein
MAKAIIENNEEMAAAAMAKWRKSAASKWQ